MIFNLAIDNDKRQAIERFKHFLDQKKVVEIKVKRKRRSISQNNYLHLILSWFGVEFGYTLEEVKQEIFKKHINTDLFYDGEKSGIVNISKWRSTSDLKTDEMTIAIDKFRNFSAKQGVYLPEPADLVAIGELERELSKHNNKQYI